MYERVEDEIKTRHIFVQQYEEYTRESISMGRAVNAILCLVCAVLLFAIPSDRDVAPWTKIVPLEILPAQTFTTTVAIIPTGQNIVPAMSARGIITVYNGSFLAQQLPAGFILTSRGGMEITADQNTTIPAGNPPAYGMAKVPAHVIRAGQSGNIPALAINQIYGTSLYLKNLTAFSGGVDVRTVVIVTDADKAAALSSARYHLNTQAKSYPAMLGHPCGESVLQNDLALVVSWICQFVSYHVPAGLHVLSVQRIGESVKLEVSR